MDSARHAAVRPRSEARYELMEPIASGGMAVIRRGFDRFTQREVAHKRLRVDREQVRPRLSALFQREYDTLARLEHPNIVDVYDYGFDAQGPYYAMELLSGADLAKIAPLPYREACRILRDVASALALLHARRLLHRDVSPNNVRLTSGGVAKLIDFGTLATFGRTAEIAGTPAFIAPESLQDVELDQRADLYSLGALAYWTLTGRCAVYASAIDDLPEAWRSPLIPASHHMPGLPHALDELLASMLSHDRAQRPNSCAEVIEQLTTIAGLEPERSERKVAYSYLKHPPLVGRREAVCTLRQALDSAIEGNGGIAIVEGMGGLGRSALLDQLTVDAQLQGATVLRAEGSAAAGPHGIARRLIHLGARIYPDFDASDAFRRQMLELESGKASGARHPAEVVERSALAAARLRKLLLQLAERGPLVILLDDADRADSESMGLLASMSDELPRQPILLVMTVREGVPEPLARAYERLARDARKIVLAHLEEAQVVELVHGVFGAVPNAHRIALWLHHETGGNPGQCVDLLRLMLQRGAIRYARGTFVLPHDVDGELARDRRTNVLLTRLSGLHADTVRLVELLSLHLGSLTLEQLAQASALPERDVVLSVELLVQRGLAFSVENNVSLRGESLRAVVEQTIETGRKRELHLALATAFANAQGDMTSELAEAWHLFRSGERGEQQAADKMVRMLDVYRHDISMSPGTVPLLEAALSVYERRGDTEVECAPLLAALSITGFFGNLGAQRKYLRRALDALSQQSGLTLARRLRPVLGITIGLWVGLIWATWFAPLFPRLLGRLSIKRRIEDLLTAASSGMATAATVYDLATAQEIQRCLEPIAGFPQRTAPGYGHSFSLASLELIASRSLIARERYQRIAAAVHEPVFLLDDRLRSQLRLGAMHGWAHCELEQPGGMTLTLADEMERGSPFFGPHAETLRALYHGVRGDSETAESHRARSEQLALRGGISWTSAALLAVRSLEAAAITRDTSTLERSSAELDRLAKAEPSLARFSTLARARLALARNQPLQAYDILRPLLEGQDDHCVANLALHTTCAEALNELSRFEEAKVHCQRAVFGLSAAQLSFSSAVRMPHIQLARAEAGLGNLELAREQLIKRLGEAELRNNPLELGALERELARLAIVARDRVAFEVHCQAMMVHFQSTQQFNLMRQREELWARAVAVGLCSPPSMHGALAVGAADPLEGETQVESRAASRMPPAPG